MRNPVNLRRLFLRLVAEVMNQSIIAIHLLAVCITDPHITRKSQKLKVSLGHVTADIITTKQINSVVSVRERTIPKLVDLFETLRETR
jgi:hypothetical protein